MGSSVPWYAIVNQSSINCPTLEKVTWSLIFYWLLGKEMTQFLGDVSFGQERWD